MTTIKSKIVVILLLLVGRLVIYDHIAPLSLQGFFPLSRLFFCEENDEGFVVGMINKQYSWGI